MNRPGGPSTRGRSAGVPPLSPPPVEALRRLVVELSGLPGIGERTAERLAFHIVKMDPGGVQRLADAMVAARKTLRPCSGCFTLSEEDPCRLCADPGRDRTRICVVETPRDLWAFEETGCYKGLYHVLGGRIAPLDRIDPEALTIEPLLERVRRGGVAEVILATNPTLEGDHTAMYIHQRLVPLGVSTTRIAKGVPTGSTLEYANRAVLTESLRGRRPMDGDPR